MRQSKSGSAKKRSRRHKPRKRTAAEMQAGIIRRAVERAGMLKAKHDGPNACRRGHLVAVRHGNQVELSDLELGVSSAIKSRSSGAAKAVFAAIRDELHKGFGGDIADLARSVANEIAEANGETMQDSTGGASAGMFSAAQDTAKIGDLPTSEEVRKQLADARPSLNVEHQQKRGES